MPAPLPWAFNRPEPLLYHFEVVHPLLKYSPGPSQPLAGLGAQK